MSIWRSIVVVILTFCFILLVGCTFTPDVETSQEELEESGKEDLQEDLQEDIVTREDQKDTNHEEIPLEIRKRIFGKEERIIAKGERGIAIDEGVSGEWSDRRARTGGTLIGIVDSKRHARQIAKLYGITLVNVVDEFALFSTGEDINEVINRGIENGWPLLEPNSVYYLS